MKPTTPLPKHSLQLLPRLLNMPYQVPELVKELGADSSIIAACIAAGCPIEGDWINGRAFRGWVNDATPESPRACQPVNRQNWIDVEAYLSYLAGPKQLDPASIRAYRIQLRRMLLWAGDRRLPDAPAIEQPYPAFLLEGGIRLEKLSPVTMDRSCDTARQFFTFAQADYEGRYAGLTKRWIDSLRMGRKNSARAMLKEHQVFDLEAVRRLLQLQPETLTEQRDMAAVAFLFLSGMRVSAFISLPADCIDLERLTVQQLPARGVRTKNGKAGITSLLNIPDLLAVVGKWDQYARENGGPGALWYLPLTSRTGEARGDGSSESANRDHIFRRGLRRLCQKHGLSYLSPHKLRHGHAVYGVKHARNMTEYQAVSQNLMHESISITSGIYARLSADDVNRVITGLSGSNDQPAGDQSALILQALAKLINNPGLLNDVLAA